MFGAGPYSTAGGRQIREVGKPNRTVAEITIKARTRKGGKKVGRHWRPTIEPPFMPQSISDPYHPSGNSACYLIQTAHLMGCDPIYLMGFTFQNGTPYEFGRKNPVTRTGAFWDIEPPLDFLRWYHSRYPGRVRLLPGWSGPIYDVFPVERFDEAKEEARVGEDLRAGRDQPEQSGGPPAEGVRQDE